MDFKDHISHAKMIYQAQPNAFTAAAYQAILSIEKQFTWQPIETAPKDKLVLIAFYWKKNKRFYEAGATWDMGVGIYNGGRYLDVLCVDLEDMDAVWMPLPEPPKEGL